VNFAITGANGFLGVHIIHHLLNSGHSVKAIIRPNACLDEFELIKQRYALSKDIYTNLSWHTCELFDVVGLEQAFYGADYIVHLAGKISYLKKDLPSLIQINQGYTANIVNVALSLKVKKLLFCSSIAAISKNSKNESITEETEWDDEIAHSNYGFTKYLGECEVWRGREEGLATVAINPGIILGYGDSKKGSNKLFDNAKSGFPFYSRGITGWVGVRDVARIAERLCLSDITGERFIVVSENKSFKDIADIMTNAVGTKKPVIEIKELLYKMAYGIVAVKEFLGLGGMLSKETVRASVSINHFDNSKVKKALAYDFETMKEVIQDSV